MLFGKSWMKASGMTEEKAKSGNAEKIFGSAFVFIFIAALNLAFFLSDSSISASSGALYGFLTGFGWVLTGIGVVALFEQKSWTYILINGFYWIVSLTVMGLILGAWK
jgi:membrane-associated HD superfamily phosphohydrolase